MTHCCPTCGRPMPEPSSSAQARGGVALSSIKRRIMTLITRRPGASADELAEWLYAHDVNGGPNTGRKTIHVHISQINRCLEAAGSSTRIRGSKYTGYVVTEKPEGRISV